MADNSGGSGTISVAGGSTLLLGSANAAAAAPVTLRGGSTLKLRADADTSFAVGSPFQNQSSSGSVTFDLNSLTAGVNNHAFSLGSTLTFTASADQTINVTGNSTYSLVLPGITLTSASHNPFFNLFINATNGGAMFWI